MKKFYLFFSVTLCTVFFFIAQLQAQCPPPWPDNNKIKTSLDITVVKPSGEIFYFINADDAFTFAQNGDYVYLPGGGLKINKPINKGIKIIGAGHFDDSTKVTYSTWIMGSISIDKGADNLLIEGLYIEENINFNYNNKTDNVTIKRCNFSGLTFKYSPEIQIADSLKSANLNLINNVIRLNCNLGGTINANLKGNIIVGFLNYLANAQVENNLLFCLVNNGKMININNVVFKNNIFRLDQSFSEPKSECFYGVCGSFDNSFINNIFCNDSATVNIHNGIANNIINTIYSLKENNLFVRVTKILYTEYDNYHIKEGSPARFFGDDGTDPGIYGSAKPYKEGAIPCNPHISSISGTMDTPYENKVQIKIKVIAQPPDDICPLKPCNFITEYKYWWGNKPAEYTTVKLSKPAEIAYITHSFNISDIHKNKFKVNFMFKDTNGLWSSVAPIVFYPKADFNITNNPGEKATFSFSNKSIFYTSLQWDFGDKSPASSVTSPAHQYLTPGTYIITLKAKNDVSETSVTKAVNIQYVSSVFPESAGNTGKVTIFVYGVGYKEGTTFFLRKSWKKIYSDSVRVINPSTLMAIFDLNGKEIGAYDVAVQVPGESERVLNNNFNIVETRAAEPWVNISGRQNILLNAWQDYSLNYGNNGNIDALGVPVWIAVPDIDNFEIKFNNITVNHSKYAIDKDLNAGIDTNYNFFRTDTVFGEAFKAKVYSFYIPVIPAGNSFSAKLGIKTSGDCKIISWTNPTYFQTGPDNDFAACLFNAFNEGIITIPQGSIPTLNCLDSISKEVFEPWPAYSPAEPLKWQSWHWNTLASLKGCNDNLNISDTLTNALVGYALNLSQYSPKIEECDNIFKVLSREDMSIHIVASLDPNEKTGPAGYSDVNYFKPAKVNPYTIFFENKADATAPAHKVVITDTLDLSRFNIKDFYFSDISFGDTVISPQNGLKEFTADINLNPAKELIVRINAMLDTVKGVAIWEFLSLDPKTMALTDSIELGFLPPNINKPEGEGSVSFIIGLKDSLNNNDIIKNKAYVYFDYNDPIITNEYINTIDTENPLSAVSALAPFNTDSVFTVSWNGTDNGSGIRYYSVFVTTNDMDTIEWKSQTTDTSAVFTAKPGNFYKFFSIATDNIGNIESKTSFDSETSILTALNSKNNPASANFYIYPNPSKGAISINYTLSRPSDVSFSIYNILGQKIYSSVNISNTKGAYKTYISLPDVPGGLYFIYFNTAYSSIAKKLIISK